MTNLRDKKVDKLITILRQKIRGSSATENCCYFCLSSVMMNQMQLLFYVKKVYAFSAMTTTHFMLFQLVLDLLIQTRRKICIFWHKRQSRGKFSINIWIFAPKIAYFSLWISQNVYQDEISHFLLWINIRSGIRIHFWCVQITGIFYIVW